MIVPKYLIETSRVWAPGLADSDQYPPVIQIRSVHNTPIKGLWHWFLKTSGRNIKDIIHSGYINGIYNPSNRTHV